jgi:hypothetical protein
MMHVANIVHHIEILPAEFFILDDSPSVESFLYHDFFSIDDFEMTDEFQWSHVHDTRESDVIRTAEIVNWPALRECSRIIGKKIAEVSVKRNLFSLFFVHMLLTLPTFCSHIQS